MFVDPRNLSGFHRSNQRSRAASSSEPISGDLYSEESESSLLPSCPDKSAIAPKPEAGFIFDCAAIACRTCYSAKLGYFYFGYSGAMGGLN